MARRRSIRSGPPPAPTAFKSGEIQAIHSGLGKLYYRSLAHLVAPKFALPYLPDAYKAMIKPTVWETLAEADRMIFGSGNHDNSENTTVELRGSAQFDVRSPTYLPEYMHLRDDEKVPEAWPTVVEEYVAAANECRLKWQAVVDLADVLHKDAKRSTAVYSWPCCTALMGLGGVAYDGSEITRPVPLTGELAARVSELRDSNTFVMQHMLLPKVEKPPVALWQGDRRTGIAVGLEFAGGLSMDGHKQLWPLSEP